MRKRIPRKLKSGKQIKEEIDLLFENVKSKKELTERVVNYLNSITGDELIGRNAIETIMTKKLIRFINSNGDKYVDIDKFSDMFSLRTYILIDKRFEATRQLSDRKIYIFAKRPPIMTRVLKCMLIEENIDWKDESEIDILYSERLKSNKQFKKLHNYFEKNEATIPLLIDCIETSCKAEVGYLISKNLTPLIAILHYFDRNKSIAENVEHFYKIMDKRYSRHTIQQAIKRNLYDIRKRKI